MENEEEEWRNIRTHDGYQISSLGNVRSIDRVIIRGNIRRFYRGRLILGGISGAGYRHVALGSGYKRHMIHRLVAEAFIPKKHGRKFVNHVNGNKLDNSVYNLEWVSHKQNLRHASVWGLLAKNK